MKKVFFLVSILTASLASAWTFAPTHAFAGTAYEDANAVYEDTASFDGGYGSTINTEPNEADGDADYTL